MTDPKLMSNDGLIQRLTVKAAMLDDDLINQELYILKKEALIRMGKPNNAHNNALSDALIEITKAIADLSDEQSRNLCDRYFQIKEEILKTMTENSSCGATMATALQS